MIVRNAIIAAAIIALGLLAHGFLLNGRYEIVRASDAGAFRLDRWTGAVAICSQWEGGDAFCANLPEHYKSEETSQVAN